MQSRITDYSQMDVFYVAGDNIDQGPYHPLCTVINHVRQMTNIIEVDAILR
jgi:hypothetical protein